jgi:hypothetical protein
MQAWILVKLNFNRLILKSKVKWVLLVLLVVEIVIFVVINNALSRIPTVPFGGLEFEVRLSNTFNYDSSAVPNLNVQQLFSSQFRNFTQIKKQDFLEAARKASFAREPLFVEFLSEKEYSLNIISSSGSEEAIYGCLGKNCRLSYSDQMVLLMAKVDAALSRATAPPLTIMKSFQPFSGGITSRDNLLDFFYLVISTLLVKGLIEDRTKGIKFGLFMTGVKRSSYYIGILTIPLVLSLGTCSMYFIMTTILSKNPALVPIAAVFYFITALSYPAFFWFSAQISSNIKTASLLNLLFIAFGIIPTLGSSQVDEFLTFQFPKVLTIIACINPRFGFGMYRYLSAMDPFGVGFSNKELLRNSLSGINH